MFSRPKIAHMIWRSAGGAGGSGSKREVPRPGLPGPLLPNYLTYLHEMLQLPTGRQQSCVMSSPTRSGASFVRCYLPSRAAYPASMIGASSMASSGCCDLALPGGTFQPIYGPRTTCYNRFVRWRRAGIWDSIMQALTARRMLLCR
mgnify:CR=1 FL=1